MRSSLLFSSLLLVSAAFAQDGGLPASIELLEQAQRVLTLPGVQRIAIGEPNVADVKTIGSDQVLVVGGDAGKTTLVVWLKDGKRQDIVITVKRGQREAADVEALELEQGELKSLKATGVTGVALGDPRVLEATLRAGRLQLRGLAPGRCDVVLVRKTGDSKLVVEVTAPEGGAAMTLTGVQLKAGHSVTLLLEGAAAATSKNPAVCESKAPVFGRVTLRGVSAGKGTVELIVSGQTMTLPVEVLP